MIGIDAVVAEFFEVGLLVLVFIFPVPRPGISKPYLRDDMKLRALTAAVPGCNAEIELACVVGFGSLDKYIPVRIIAENTSIDQAIFWLFLRASSVLPDKVFVGKLSLRIFIQVLYIRMLNSSEKHGKGNCITNRWKVVEMKVSLFYRLTMVGLLT